MLTVFITVIKRDLLLSVRRRADVANTLIFFILVASLFPLGVGPEPNVLRTIAPGVIWVAALLASILAMGRMFAADYADGALEQIALSPAPLGLIAIGKVIAHWLVSGFPLIVLAPVLALQFDLPRDALLVLMASLALGTPSLTLVGAIGAALTVGVRGAGVLTSLLVLPLYVPVLILGTGAVDAAAGGLAFQAHLMLLGAFLVLAAAFAPWAIAAALRISLD